MTRFGAVALLAANLLALPLQAQPSPTEAELHRHVEYLASDELEGRRPGTPGEALSAEYVARHFAEAGLEPGYADGFLDAVELVDRRLGMIDLSWSKDDETIRIEPNGVIGFGRSATERLEGRPVVSLGYGREIDAAAVDLEGAVAVLLANQPGVAQNVDEFETRRRRLAGRGVAAIVGLTVDRSSWEVVSEMAARGRTDFAATPTAPLELVLSPETAGRLLGEGGIDIARVARQASAPDFAPERLPVEISGTVETGVYPVTGHNVLARLPGTGTGGEAVLFLAHHDHLGLCRPEGAADRICNGAVDNASGVAALIEIAEAMAAGPPPIRDVYFLATTAEELGLFGARAFVEDPPVPISRFVAALNLDTVATSPAGSPLTTVGRGMTPIDPVADRVAAELGRRVYEGEEMNALVDRQDGAILLDAGVPSVLIGGMHAVSFQRFLVGPYHSPADELTADIDLSGLAEDVAFHVALGRALADPAIYRPPPR